ncbi:hypothetical protein BO83DRAFT_380835 [Aspergillus eucalypticola CBS 122712]|uniref:Uncharacterized protein n=1 Tax=Aspergillus eucalypticola (strain CBS 122712 / IBT 29274) TaxID=1448314 RepID=A0A317V028_ASPEC|nr:uncharacterized protein BO83DRAFT_380835 [Aspergillus eucalypticola CBS 122712]PWY66999.1 hypothetical protein BO83DRAFT_380835 [Aspergillus eucalypticola CBS 122712]
MQPAFGRWIRLFGVQSPVLTLFHASLSVAVWSLFLSYFSVLGSFGTGSWGPLKQRHPT